MNTRIYIALITIFASSVLQAEQQITELQAELKRLRNTPLKVEHYRAGALVESGAVRIFDGEPLQFNFSKRN